jgi:hypothetical protein
MPVLMKIDIFLSSPKIYLPIQDSNNEFWLINLGNLDIKSDNRV